MVNQKIEDVIKDITETQGGFAVKSLSYKKQTNTVTGLVQSPIDRDNIRNGFHGIMWDSYGRPRGTQGKSFTDEYRIKLR